MGCGSRLLGLGEFTLVMLPGEMRYFLLQEWLEQGRSNDKVRDAVPQGQTSNTCHSVTDDLPYEVPHPA